MDAKIRWIKTLLLCWLLSSLHLWAQQDSTSTLPKQQDDKTRMKTDSLLLEDIGKDSLKKDSLRPLPLFEPLHQHGSISLLNFPSVVQVNRRDYQQQNYTELADIIEQNLPGAFPLHLGYYGQNNQLILYGGSIRDNAVLFNGRPLNDVTLGAFDLQQYPPEFLENAEILRGSDAVIVADNASGFVLNLQEPRYNTKNPYTRLWYSQAGYGFISSDGVYSQNVAPNLNLTLGYRRLSGNGRYRNQFVDSWNVRGLLRWNISPRTNISLVELFSNHGNGTNGGVDTTETIDINDDISANVLFPTMEERVFRHDATLSFSSYIAEDSTTALFATLYGSHALWERNRDEGLALHAGDSARLMTIGNNRFGATMRFEQQLWKGMILRIGGESDYQSADISVYSEGTKALHLAAFGHMQYNLSDVLRLRGGIRPRFDRDKFTLAVGGAIDISVHSHFEICADISRSDRLPTLVEGWSRDREHQTFMLAELRFKDTLTTVSFSAFSRFVENPLLATPRYADSTVQILITRFHNGESRNTTGAVLSASTLLKTIRISAFAQSYFTSINGNSVRRLPVIYGGIRAQYEYTYGSSLLFAGFSLKARTVFDGEEYLPQNWSYIPAPLEQNAAFNGMDGFAGARLGNAFIKISVQNIFGSSYTTLSTFPQLDRNIRLSVAWTFFD